MGDVPRIKSVAIIGAGAAGAMTAAAFAAENYFSHIKVFERREAPGGTWIYDPTPPSNLPLRPGSLPTDLDRPPTLPKGLPTSTPPNQEERYTHTPVYSSLTTNVPSIAMSFSDSAFPYGPFVPHHIPRQYIESYFSSHGIDSVLSLNTTVEDLSVISSSKPAEATWKLTLRKHDPIRAVDDWWTESFDAVILANGHYSIPYIPEVKGLNGYMALFPNTVKHSKTYRSPYIYQNKKVLIIGNSASGRDLTAELVQTAQLPIYQSRRSASRWDGNDPPFGVAWKPVVKEYLPNGTIIFEDGTYLDGIDTVIYCTGYKPSFPFWNVANNGRELWDYTANKLRNIYLHTFFQDFHTLGIVGMPRVLTFRSFEYQAIALARRFSGRSREGLPSTSEQQRWEREREIKRRNERKNFHDIEWETGETMNWLGELFGIAGLPRLTGEGRTPPVLGKEVRWALEHLKKYPEPGKYRPNQRNDEENGIEEEWVVVDREQREDVFA